MATYPRPLFSLSERPQFVWNNISGATKYNLVMCDPSTNDTLWTANDKDSKLTVETILDRNGKEFSVADYPEGEPSLSENIAYELSITTETVETTGQVVIYCLEEYVRQAVQQYEDYQKYMEDTDTEAAKKWFRAKDFFAVYDDPLFRDARPWRRICLNVTLS
ncbi:MAG: hypothetical protein AAGG02_06170 [Cyanobacteria bacterium P01_H01_bin.15]